MWKIFPDRRGCHPSGVEPGQRGASSTAGGSEDVRGRQTAPLPEMGTARVGGEPPRAGGLVAALTCEELDEPNRSSDDFLRSLFMDTRQGPGISTMCLFVGSVYTLPGGSIRPIRPYGVKPDRD